MVAINGLVDMEDISDEALETLQAEFKHIHEEASAELAERAAEEAAAEAR